MKQKEQVVIVGAGFAGLRLAKDLDPDLFDVVLIDRQNHHQFQPLFYQVATAVIEPSSISFPLRNIFKRKPHVSIKIAEVQAIDATRRVLQTDHGSLSYDRLVLAMGCKTNFWGNKALEENAFQLKTTGNALSIRNHILETFETILELEEAAREPYYQIVIVGAGPTGVELAGAFAEIRNYILPKDYPGFDFSRLKVHLIEAAPAPLNNMSERSKTKARQYLDRMGVRTLTGVTLQAYQDETVVLSSGEHIKTKTLIWTAGVIGNRIEGLEQAAYSPTNRIAVDRQNRVMGYEHIYALGDVALMETETYPKGHPQIANVAINQAKLLADNLRRMQKGRKLGDYEYKDLGSMATIGRNKAVVDLPYLHFSGYFAFLVWMFLHLMLILTVRNKLIIFINWVWAYYTKDTSLRLILKPKKAY